MGRPGLAILPLLAGLLAAAAAARAEPRVLELDPAATEIRFTLGATLHTVEGRFALIRGRVRFDPATGAASGAVVVDATSGDTGIDRRDRNMHRDVLASAEHPEMVLRPERIAVSERGPDALAGTVHGTLEIRGERHPLEVRFAGRREDGRGVVEASFDVPFVAWGLPDPSTFLLRVDDTLHVEVTTAGALHPAR